MRANDLLFDSSPNCPMVWAFDHFDKHSQDAFVNLVELIKKLFADIPALVRRF